MKTILVVDDDLGMIRLLEKRLRSDGFEVIGALNGRTGLKKAKEVKPDLILLDILMPDISGGEGTRQLQLDPELKDIPIIFITVTIDKKEDKVDKEIELDGHVYPAFAKPLHHQKLMSVIKKELKRTGKE